MTGENTVPADELRAFIERIERMEEEKSAIGADIKEIFAEAKGRGYDTKVIRQIVKIRKQDANERAEQEAVLDLYMGALGMVGGASSTHVVVRNSQASGKSLDVSSIDPELLATIIEGSRTAAGRKIIQDALQAVNAPGKPAASPVARADALAKEQADNGVEWVRDLPVEPTRHAYSKAFAKLGQDHVVIQRDIEGAKSAPIVVIGDEILDGWARFNSARCTIGLDGQSTFFPVAQYEGADPLLDCIKWNIAGRSLSDKDKQTVVARLCAIEPKRKAEIIKAVAEMAI